MTDLFTKCNHKRNQSDIESKSESKTKLNFPNLRTMKSILGDLISLFELQHALSYQAGQEKTSGRLKDCLICNM